MRKLHELPTFRDRWSYLYLEHGRLDQEAAGLTFHDAGRQHAACPSISSASSCSGRGPP